MQYQSGNWPAYNVKAIVASVQRVFNGVGIDALTKNAYQFITLHMGFIAHYDLNGFKYAYEDLKEFSKALLTSEYSRDEHYNLREADRQENDTDFKKWYGEAYQKSVAKTIRAIVEVADSVNGQAILKF